MGVKNVKKLKMILMLFLAIGIMFLGYQETSCKAYTKVKAVKKSETAVLKIVLSNMFSTPDQKLKKIFQELATVYSQNDTVLKQGSKDEVNQYDTLIKKSYGEYITDDCLKPFKGDYLGWLQGLALDSNDKMSVKKIVVNNITSTYYFTVIVEYGKDLKDEKVKTAKVTGYAYFRDGKICTFRIVSDGGLGEGLRGDIVYKNLEKLDISTP